MAMTFSTRLPMPDIAPEGYAVLVAVEGYIKRCGLPHRLLDLVKMRASQINGCAFCLDMHSKDARKLGETEQRLYLLNAWNRIAIGFRAVHPVKVKVAA